MAVYKRGDMWWVDVYVGQGRNKKRLRKSTGCTEEVQARIVEQTMLSVNRGLTSRQRAQSILDNVLPAEERSLKIESCRDYYEECLRKEPLSISRLELQKRLNSISRMSVWVINNTNAKWAHDVTAEIAWSYSCSITSRGVTARTRNNEISHLRTTWKLLQKHGKVDENPWGLARAVRNRDEEKQGRAFTDDEINRILDVSRQVGCEWEGVVTVALYTGLRKRDVECLKWESVKDDFIELAPSKTKRKGVRVRIPIHPKVAEALAKADRTTPFVFPWREAHPNGRRPKADDVFFSEVMAKAGIVAKENEKVSFHSLRHTFVTRLAEAGVAEDVRMRLAGHTNAVTHGIYTHEDSQSKAAINTLK